jgi:hypothetical protein
MAMDFTDRITILDTLIESADPGTFDCQLLTEMSLEELQNLYVEIFGYEAQE